MANCDICGKTSELVITEIGGVEVEACSACSGFGKVKQKTRIEEKFEQHIMRRERRNAPRPTEVIPLIVEDFSQRIKKRRERLGLKQAELAKKLAEKESVISSLESGSMEPSVALAQKIERILSLKLIDTEEQKAPSVVMHEKSAGLTLGDMIKIRKK